MHKACSITEVPQTNNSVLIRQVIFL